MIISHKYKFIFVAIPKTGTHSVRFALRQHLGPNDWEQVELFAQKRLPFPELAKKKHGHISLKEIKPLLEEDIWQKYFKFGFARNPWSRIISFYFFKYRNNQVFLRNPIGFIKITLNQLKGFDQVLTVPQHELITDEADRIVLDYIGKYEHLQQNYDYICKQVGIPTTALRHMNESQHLAYIDYYDEELKRLVEEKYKKDIQLFDYAFDEVLET